MKKIFLSLLASVLFTACTQSSKKETAEAVTDSTSHDAPAFRPSNIEDEVKYNRAIEAVIWGIPAVNYDAMYQAATRDTKASVNQLVYWSHPSDWKNQTLTPNADALYILPFFNTKDVGPIVLEIPPADSGSIVGTIMDCWQVALEDVGRAGADKGKGGKYLILPPGHKGKIPSGYIILPSDNYQGYALLRSIPKSSSQSDIAAAVTYLKRIKLYPLSKSTNPPQTIFVDANNILFDANIPYDQRFFESLDRIVQTEPWIERDRVMINSLKSIGIEKGKSFEPDAKTLAMLNTALQDGKQWLSNYYETAYAPFYSDKHWMLPADPVLLEAVATGFKNSNVYPIDSRGTSYYFAFSSVKHMGAGQFYLFVARDNNNQILDGSKNYKLIVPPKVPVHQYWSLTLYDFATHALIRDVAYASRSSLTQELKANADGTVDLYFGPTPPPGKESNWIPTKAGGRFEAIFRLYGPKKEFFDKKPWVLPDIEEFK
jgi:hypothetical protein